jgi:Kef-type K+ transport system membrane component KefB
MLTSLALIFLCGLLLGSVCQKLKLPSLIGMLITGIVLGPYALNLLDGSILSISSDLRQLAMGLPCWEIVLSVAVISVLFTAPLGAFLLDVSYKKLLIKRDD